jgi:hypothetical protein
VTVTLTVLLVTSRAFAVAAFGVLHIRAPKRKRVPNHQRLHGFSSQNVSLWSVKAVSTAAVVAVTHPHEAVAVKLEALRPLAPTGHWLCRFERLWSFWVDKY